ncbi:MAG: Sec-independent protein translocase protein TatB [Cypionkella sp.]
MFGDIGFAELMLIGIIALIVVGPEDLPQMFRQLGRFTAKIKAMGREFSRAMEQAANETGVRDVAKDLKDATSAKAMGLDKVKEAADRFEKWDPIKNAAKPTPVTKPLTPPPMPATVPPVTSESIASPSILGPETQALMDQKAAKQAIIAESNAKLKALDAPAKAAKAPPKSAVKPAAKAAPKSRVKVAEAVPVAAKPRAPRKPKVSDKA